MLRPTPTQLTCAWLFAVIVVSHVAIAPSPAQATEPPLDRLEGIWEGKYICYQGPTAVSVTLGRLDATGTTQGTFTFGSFPGATNARAGKYALSVSFDGGADRLVAVPAGWIEQPENYVQVGFTATLDVSGQIITGRVDHETCSSIELHRRAVS